MRTVVRLKLDMATRAMDFCRAHPDTTSNWTEAMARFEERLARAQALVTQQLAGDVTAHASVLRKKALRDRIAREPLTHLARIARAASEENPAVANQFQVPRLRTSDQSFLGDIRRLSALAATHKELFMAFGMPATFLDELNAAIGEFQTSVTETNTAVVAHVGAVADLGTVAAELLQVIAKLDAMIRFRFRSDSELLAAWTSARNVAWPAAADAPAPTAPSPSTTPRAA